MAVAVDQRLTPHGGPGKLGRMAGEKLIERAHLPREAPRVLVVPQQVRQLVPEDGRAARLQHHDRKSRPDGGAERSNDALQVPTGETEKAVVVQRPATAELGP